MLQDALKNTLEAPNIYLILLEKMTHVGDLHIEIVITDNLSDDVFRSALVHELCNASNNMLENNSCEFRSYDTADGYACNIEVADFKTEQRKLTVLQELDSRNPSY